MARPTLSNTDDPEDELPKGKAGEEDEEDDPDDDLDAVLAGIGNQGGGDPGDDDDDPGEDDDDEDEDEDEGKGNPNMSKSLRDQQAARMQALQDEMDEISKSLEGGEEGVHGADDVALLNIDDVIDGISESVAKSIEPLIDQQERDRETVVKLTKAVRNLVEQNASLTEQLSTMAKSMASLDETHTLIKSVREDLDLRFKSGAGKTDGTGDVQAGDVMSKSLEVDGSASTGNGVVNEQRARAGQVILKAQDLGRQLQKAFVTTADVSAAQRGELSVERVEEIEKALAAAAA